MNDKLININKKVDNAEIIYEQSKTLQKYLQDNFLIEERIVNLEGEIEEVEISYVLRSIEYLDSINSSKPITLKLSSFGGSVYEALALYDILRACKSPIIISCRGKIMSAGTIILLGGDAREAHTNTTFMFHEIYSVSLGKMSEMKEDLKETERLNDIICSIYADHSTKDFKWWNKHLKHIDRFYTAEQVKDIGIIHSIIQPNVKIKRKG